MSVLKTVQLITAGNLVAVRAANDTVEPRDLSGMLGEAPELFVWIKSEEMDFETFERISWGAARAIAPASVTKIITEMRKAREAEAQARWDALSPAEQKRRENALRVEIKANSGKA